MTKWEKTNEITAYLHFYVYLVVSYFLFVFLIKTKLKMLTKRPPVATSFPSGASTIIGALIYRVYLRTCDPGPINPTTFLGLCSPVTTSNQSFQTSVPTFTSTQKALRFTTYGYVFRSRTSKRCDLWWNLFPWLKH